ncbi:MAG: flagellar assembly peptidoglycan hydrolase FlgJ [Gammaproteobacteria bacterium]|uniref:flagellar assembly peptidoglycan hydrolase FlgJ n=1 Tax=Rhodoferax sp. TaxID=50421 RepID=UPI00185B2673|nr:flagellar assembly peptidoglycan hydrolase FlgJ [Rhodoferax sp.]MBU3899287.1 flagellar assembly peptidoglycan hydrolase FlgJ [Gammaproteobacteria bacterium]MBA3058168.1 flagellar assembly peptidoglycan hydrolase FlgJ [Rhodoferax sp.]MBU3996911.1 flagellar assembly peptidoglycan hydrolase FlgJ [Gammaproteobacteria bacterium]MBU4081263.1 flagellar assembly peptidoglycan hydrolase FlgJ [Gammaproteobacteria bacterium]MBU4115274.1 flagellar assembly peptidoglycan hydrolase FlgJ [Gammaproteobacte
MSYGQLSTGTGALAADARSLNNLKMQAGQKTPEAIKEAAKQFESLFMRELIKSMREATMKSGMLDSPGGDLGGDLLDQQLAVQMSGKPGGLSDLIAAQLSRQMAGPALGSLEAGENLSAAPLSSVRKAASLAAYGAQAVPSTTPPTVSQSHFVQRHTDAAIKVEQATGIPASYMVGQAGHETGWGRHEIKMKGGAPSFNLFGIKAGAGWSGKVAEVTTTEYVNGAAKKTLAKFRAYDSYEASFKDYARLITKSPRYAQASQQTDSAHAFASGLQKAGYATDPDYANKLTRAIHTTQRLQRAQVVAQNI